MPHKDKEKIKQYQAEYRKSNKSKKYQREYQGEYQKEYRKTYLPSEEQEKHRRAYMKQYNKEYRETEPFKTLRASEEYKKKANILNKAKYREKKEFLDSVKKFYGCMNPNCPCTFELDCCCIDFHHAKDTKEFHVGSGCGKKRLVAELRKCTVLCVVCHRMVTWGSLDDSNFPTCNINDNCEILLVQH